MVDGAETAGTRTWLGLVQGAASVAVLVLLLATVVLDATDVVGAWLWFVALGAGLACAVFNHVVNAPNWPSD